MRRFLSLTMAALMGPLLASCDAKTNSAPAPLKGYDLTAASNQKFLADNAAKQGVFKRPDGLEYRIIKSGKGKSPTGPDDLVSVTYKGWLINGKVFDQTHGGRPATFPAGGLIPGWVEALSLMKEGDEWELVIPSDLGYGAEGAGDGVIPPNQTLVFDMTLLSVSPAASQP